MANLNFDMVASPNPVRFIYDGDGSHLGQPGPAGSEAIESMFTDWFDHEDLDWEPTAFDGRSDYGPFIWSDIPAVDPSSSTSSCRCSTVSRASLRDLNIFQFPAMNGLRLIPLSSLIGQNRHSRQRSSGHECQRCSRAR